MEEQTSSAYTSGGRLRRVKLPNNVWETLRCADGTLLKLKRRTYLAFLDRQIAKDVSVIHSGNEDECDTRSSDTAGALLVARSGRRARTSAVRLDTPAVRLSSDDRPRADSESRTSVDTRTQREATGGTGSVPTLTSPSLPMRNVPDVSQARASLRTANQTSQLEARRASFVSKLAQRVTEEPSAAPDPQSVTPLSKPDSIAIAKAFGTPWFSGRGF